MRVCAVRLQRVPGWCEGMTPAENHPLPAVRVKAESYGQRPAGSAGSLGRIPTVTGERIRAAAVLRGADAGERPDVSGNESGIAEILSFVFRQSNLPAGGGFFVYENLVSRRTCMNTLVIVVLVGGLYLIWKMAGE